MIKLRMRMTPVVLWGAAVIIGALFFQCKVDAADTPSAPSQVGGSVNAAAAAKKATPPGSPPQVTLPPGRRQVVPVPATPGAQISPPAGSLNTGPPPAISVVDDRISADIKARPLSEALQAMAGKNLFDMRGPMPAGEEITAQFSGLTLDQALKKLMRGYNYVLMDQGVSQKPVLVLIGKIQRSAGSEQPAPPAQATAPGVGAGQPPAQGPSNAPQPPVSPLPRAGNRRFPVTAPPEGGTIAAAPAPTMSGGPGGPQEAEMNRQPLSQGQITGQAPVAGPVQAAGQPGQAGQTQPPAQDQPAQDGTSGSTPSRDTLGSF